MKRYLFLLLLFSGLPLTAYADEDASIDQLVEKCNKNKEIDPCVQSAEYYKKRIQLDLAYKFYKKACLIDSNAKSHGIYVCSIARNLERAFPANLFKSSGSR